MRSWGQRVVEGKEWEYICVLPDRGKGGRRGEIEMDGERRLYAGC